MENYIIISNSKDREEVATILFRNGYTVRMGTVAWNGKRVSAVFYKKGE